MGTAEAGDGEDKPSAAGDGEDDEAYDSDEEMERLKREQENELVPVEMTVETKALDVNCQVGFFPMTGAWSGGTSVWPAVQLALQDVNADPNILPATTLEVIHHDSACSATRGIELIMDSHVAYANQPTNSSTPPFVGILVPTAAS